MLMLPQLGHMTNINGFISTSISSITTKLGWTTDQQVRISCRSRDNEFIFKFTSSIANKFGRIVSKHALIFPCRYGDIITTKSYDQRQCLYLHLCKPYNQTSQKGRPGCDWLTFADVNAAAITRSYDPNLWLYLEFQKPPNN